VSDHKPINERDMHVSDDEFVRRCRARGDDDASIARTLMLTKAIESILKNQDIDPFRAPETQMSKTIRLSRLFMTLMAEECAATDRGLVGWLGELGHGEGVDVEAVIAEQIRNGDHWRWMRAHPKVCRP
jgi:hypothetical protein